MRPLSHSSISLYTDCPQKYKFKYVDKLPEKPKSFFSFGRSVHSALEFFYNVPALPAPRLDQVLARFKADWLSEGYKDAEQETEHYQEGERILRAFYAKHIGDFQPPFFAEYKFDIQVDGVPVTGYVDRIDRAGKDGISIVDYKTGKSFSEDRVRTDAQLTMYQMACEELLGMKVESLTFYHLNSLTPMSAPAHSKKQVAELRTRVATVADSISKGLFDPKPEERKCGWCDFKPHCPLFRDQFSPLNDLLAAADAALKPAVGDDLTGVIDAYGRILGEIAALEARADELSETIVGKLKAKGWVRAFGHAHEAALSSEEKWEFEDKAKVLDLIRRAGRWEDILAPSAPLVQKLMNDPSVPLDLRDRLMKLGRKVPKDVLQSRKLESSAVS